MARSITRFITRQISSVVSLPNLGPELNPDPTLGILNSWGESVTTAPNINVVVTATGDGKISYSDNSAGGGSLGYVIPLIGVLDNTFVATGADILVSMTISNLVDTGTLGTAASMLAYCKFTTTSASTTLVDGTHSHIISGADAFSTESPFWFEITRDRGAGVTSFNISHISIRQII